MKKIYLFLIAMVMVAAVFAQKPEITVKSTGTAPAIDAIADDMWAGFEKNKMEKPYSGTNPTVTPTFQLAWDNDNLYMLLIVEDDDHFPSWESKTASYESDKVEVYFDVNDVLNDAKGPSTAGSGHYQVAPDYVEANYGVAATTATETVCYDLDGEGVIYEASYAWSRFANLDKVAQDIKTIQALPEGLGFDVTVVDRDEATGVRDRMVWANDNAGALGESWTNMDECGVLKIDGTVGVNKIAAASMKVYPNPVIDQLTISAKFNKVVISNLVGQQVKTIDTASKTINVSDLSKGVYVVKAFNNGKLVGTSKMTKN